MIGERRRHEKLKLLDHAKLGAASAGIYPQFFFSRCNRLLGDLAALTGLLQERELLLHYPVLDAVEGNDCYATAGSEFAPCAMQACGERAEFVVDGDAEGLKGARRRMNATVPI